jgi:hypothetical protein
MVLLCAFWQTHAAQPRLQTLTQSKWTKDGLGYVCDVKVSGNYAYLAASGDGLVVFDISNPTNCVRVGGYRLGGDAREIQISGHYAYLADYKKGLQIIDISNPAQCLLVNSYTNDGYLGLSRAANVAIQGNYAYILFDLSQGYTTHESFHVVDISDPTNCIARSIYNYNWNSPWTVAVSGNYAYMNAGTMLDKVNVSGGGCAHVQYSAIIGSAYTDVYHIAIGDYIYAVGMNSGFSVLDLSNPRPLVIGRCSLPYTSWCKVTPAGSYAYVASDTAGLQVITVTNPAAPLVVATNPVLGHARSVAVSGHYAYVAAYEAGLQVFDVNDPVHPVCIGSYDMSRVAYEVAGSGNTVFIADSKAGLEVIDTSNPAKCVRVGRYYTPGQANNLAVASNYVYVADGMAGLTILDASTPTNCVGVGRFDTPGYAAGIAVEGHYAYVTDGDAGVQIIDVIDPTNCARVGGYASGGNAMGIAVGGGYIYLADWTNGLHILDARDPSNCVSVTDYNASLVRDVAVVGNRAYLADGAGLEVLDVSNPSTPVQLGTYGVGATGFKVAASSHYAFLLEGPRFYVFDVTEPVHPVRLVSYNTGGSPYSLALAGDRVYLADQQKGLFAFYSISNAQNMMIVTDADPGVPYVIESASVLGAGALWNSIYTNSNPSEPFEFTDFDVRRSAYTNKFYRVRQ